MFPTSEAISISTLLILLLGVQQLINNYNWVGQISLNQELEVYLLNNEC